MLVNQDPDLDRARKKIRVLEAKLSQAITAIEQGGALPHREREVLLEALRQDLPQDVKLPPGPYC